MKAQRRTIVPVNESERAWQSDRDWQVQPAINAGLGARPSAWWRYESDRRDLAQGAGLDAYVELRVDSEEPWPWRQPHPAFACAIERFRFLVASGELRPSEIAAIALAGGRVTTGAARCSTRRSPWRRPAMAVETAPYTGARL